ncbi:MAG: peptide chain release factor N(5)-glutamine methyltransferase [Planctomycetes bacterium]|nr:peptide chain release factor N(5)-glutamine methyltransferase [Planctomycetota bacterium]
MQIRDWLSAASDRLRKAGVDSPRLTASLLLGHVINKSRSELMACAEAALDTSTLAAANRLLQRRVNREPLEYITGKHEFFGREFDITKGVLIPRPETEDIILWLKENFATDAKFTCCDIGTGSGCLAITVACEFPNTKVTATDLYDTPVQITQQNASKHGIEIDITTADILEGINKTFDVIISNPPYVPESDRETLEPEVLDHEPQEALFGGQDGTQMICRMLPQLHAHLNAGGKFIVEHDLNHAETLRAKAQKQGFINVCSHQDFTGRERFLVGGISGQFVASGVHRPRL